MFLVAAFRRLPCLSLLLLMSAVLFVIWFEHRGCHIGKKWVECVESVLAARDPRSSFGLECMPQARSGNVG